ncbi:maleylpyruvate isomerase N-terminal domain-containing protein [Candidatus Saccharibacteria bacterium]|nr:maleylpyruvate isomerase N-terminal domain-containing protein [Candidatus Saccharibacteria bacterium]
MREAEMFLRADQAFTDAVNMIDDEQWEEMVPSTPDWSVRELVNHVALNNLSLTEGAHMTAEPGTDVLGEEPAERWTEIAEAAEELAETADETMATSLAAQTGDRLLHLWDLNGALGRSQVMDPKVVQFAYDFMLPRAYQLANSDAVGPVVPVSDDADVSAKILGLSGRDPGVSEGDIHTTLGNDRSV